MNAVLKKALRDTLVFGLVGVALSLFTPYLAVAVGVAPSVAEAPALLGLLAKPEWLGPFFGLFGTGAALVDPLCSFIFGSDKEDAKKKAPAEQSVVVVKDSPGQELAPEHERPVVIHLEQTARKETHPLMEAGKRINHAMLVEKLIDGITSQSL